MSSSFIKTTADLVELFATLRRAIASGDFLLIEWKVQRETRKIILNDKMWAMLTDVSKQVKWHGLWLTTTEWKDIFTASLRPELKVLPSIPMGDGQPRLVVLGLSTSKMTNEQMSLLIAFMCAFGDEHGVFWKDPKDPVNSEIPP